MLESLGGGFGSDELGGGAEELHASRPNSRSNVGGGPASSASLGTTSAKSPLGVGGSSIRRPPSIPHNLDDLIQASAKVIPKEDYNNNGALTHENDHEPCCGYDEKECEWHEVTIQPFVDPMTGEEAILVSQSDALNRVEIETGLSRLNEVRTS